MEPFFYTKWANCTNIELRLRVDDLLKSYKACEATEEKNGLMFWVKNNVTWPGRLDD